MAAPEPDFEFEEVIVTALEDYDRDWEEFSELVRNSRAEARDVADWVEEAYENDRDPIEYVEEQLDVYTRPGNCGTIMGP